ncbi:hypothetical protein [Nocardia aurea]|uniref:Uncharacterized protein n=1 Tax=Nocardia aurea TaxID=2144174 RepID=A0ABV3G110_9NOCA
MISVDGERITDVRRPEMGQAAAGPVAAALVEAARADVALITDAGSAAG